MTETGTVKVWDQAIAIIGGIIAEKSIKYTKNDNSASSQVNLGSITVERGKITKVDETTVNPD